MEQRRTIVLVYPQQGFSGNYVRHMPLSLLYVASEVIKSGWDVRVVDTRVHEDWRERLTAISTETGIFCLGISVMSGRPISHAIEIGRFAKSLDPAMPVVWGGPHATFYPESILGDEWSCDYVVSGYAAESFDALVHCLAEGVPPTEIPGISWRQDGAIRRNVAVETQFEYIDYRDIPYHLIEDYSVYGQLESDQRIFSMYSALGCPYKCSFCSSPAQYSSIKGKKWVPLDAKDVVDHIQYVVETYSANFIYFIDDDSFPKLSHVENIIDEITRRGLPVKLGFRGARINELKRMTDGFLDKLAAAGTDILHIGAECGSDRILQLIRKDCTVQDIIEVNRKLARHPQITAAYNFIMGVPTETLAELKQTGQLMLQLVKDHPNCIIFPPNKFRPLPGTELHEVASKQWGYQMPGTLSEWANIEVEASAKAGWYEPGVERMFNLMLIASYFIDNKVARLTTGKTTFFKLARLANRLYRPFALFRLRHSISFGLIEYRLYRWATRFLTRAEKTS
ncbi:MAG: hypothetical protein FD176_270 [Rhodospirillaceae bacterium]|nr:MAG: hypothetical protein FD176_270 [Rhodospirillaceae bacterium]TNC97480.1 MAG: Uncharacterized protein FD119_1080 [Stygiobacter sp.]